MNFSLCSYRFLSNYYALINKAYKMKRRHVEIDILIYEKYVYVYHDEFLDYRVGFDLNLMLHHWNENIPSSSFYRSLSTK